MLTNGDDHICIRGVLSPRHLLHLANQLVDGLQTVLGLQTPVTLGDTIRKTCLSICTKVIESSSYLCLIAQQQKNISS